MSILDAQSLHKAYGPQIILQNISLAIQPRERIGLLGVNGSGKSTLARILAGFEEPDLGTLSRGRGAHICYLAQTPDLDPHHTAEEEVLSGLGDWTQARRSYAKASEALEKKQGHLEALLAEQTRAAAEVERLGGWDLNHRAESILGQLGVVEKQVPVGQMSGGEQRRVALARILVSNPDLAILDEPTNHLDMQIVEWLEQYLVESFKGALLVITHDRYLIDRVVERTLELDRGRLYSYAGGYEEFLEAKAERLAQAERTEINRQNFLRRELEWLRTSPKARTGKQKARISRAEAAIASAPAPRPSQMALSVETTRIGQNILEIQDLELRAGSKVLIQDFDLTLVKGARVGLIGPNGCGKTTFLRAILGEIKPTVGRISLGKTVQMTYLNQTRDGLDDARSIIDNVADGYMHVTLGGRSVEIHTYLDRFLFPSHMLSAPVGSLSGGERTRVALAKILHRPTNLLILDEPTNDLDVAALGALEQLLMEAKLTALVVTHDRWFLDRVATSILAFEGASRVVHYQGNYSIYRTLRPANEEKTVPKSFGNDKPSAKRRQKPANPKRPLTYAEELELRDIYAKIETAEARVAALEKKLGDPDLYQKHASEVAPLLSELEQAKAEASHLLERWEELEAKRDRPS